MRFHKRMDTRQQQKVCKLMFKFNERLDDNLLSLSSDLEIKIKSKFFFARPILVSNPMPDVAPVIRHTFFFIGIYESYLMKTEELLAQHPWLFLHLRRAFLYFL